MKMTIKEFSTLSKINTPSKMVNHFIAFINRLMLACLNSFAPFKNNLKGLIGKRFATFSTKTHNVSGLSFFVICLSLYFTIKRMYAPFAFDEEYFIWFGWLTKNGAVAYRDFFEPKPPIIFFANATGLILGLKYNLFRLIPSITALSALFLFYKSLVHKKIKAPLVLLMTAQLAYLLLGPLYHDTGLNDTETYGLSFVLMGYSLALLSTHPNYTIWMQNTIKILAGVFWGLACLSKELFLLSVIPAVLFTLYDTQNEKWQLSPIKFYFIGIISAGLTFILSLIYNSSLIYYFELIQFYRSFASRYCLDINRFPRTSSISELLFTSLKFLGDGLHASTFAFSLPLICFGLVLQFRWNKIFLVFTALLFGAISISVGHCYWGHYFLMGVSGLIFSAVLGLEKLNDFIQSMNTNFSSTVYPSSEKFTSKDANSLQISTRLLFCIVLLTILLSISISIGLKKDWSVRYSFNPNHFQGEVFEAVQSCTREDDYILSTGSPLINVLTNRKSPLKINSFFDELIPYMQAQHSIEQIKKDLEAHPPQLIHLSPFFASRQALYRKLIFDDFIKNKNYLKISENTWCLPK